jgi:hypothetical protein
MLEMLFFEAEVTTPRTHYCIRKEIKSKPDSGNASYHAVQNIMITCNQPTAKSARNSHQKLLVKCLLKMDA